MPLIFTEETPKPPFHFVAFVHSPRPSEFFHPQPHGDMRSVRSMVGVSASWLAKGAAGPPARSIVTAAEVLRRKRIADADYVIGANQPLSAAVSRLAEKGKVHALVVVSDTERHVVGITTARDVLRGIDNSQGDVSVPVMTSMTHADKMVHILPQDNITQAALLMSELKIAHLPVIQDGEILGVISLQDIADVALEATRGGKDAVVRRVLPRRGISRQTTVASAARQAEHHQANHRPLFLKTGDAEFPRAKRDETPIEDAHFISHVWWPGLGATSGGATNGHTMTYIGVADGVGSWHQFNVDPRIYAQNLMKAAQEYIWKRASSGAPPPSTQDVLTAAWEAVREQQTVGSATACILALDCMSSKCSSGVLPRELYVVLQQTLRVCFNEWAHACAYC